MDADHPHNGVLFPRRITAPARGIGRVALSRTLVTTSTGLSAHVAGLTVHDWWITQLVGQRTQAINALRGHAMEFGVVAAKGAAKIAPLLTVLAADATIPEVARAMFEQMGAHIEALESRIAGLDAELVAIHKAHPVSRLLAEIPGVGPMIATTMALTVEPENFASGRHFAAWLGLTPREHSTGGKQRLGKISKAGNERLRTLLVVGAMSIIRFAKPGSKSASPWLLQLLERKPRKLAAVALANKMARIIWAMMARGEAYRRQPVVA